MPAATFGDPAQDVDLPAARYGVGVSWDLLAGRQVDIDLQCVVVNNAGAIVDCAYYNNLKAARAVTHSGDEASCKPQGMAEVIWANLHKLPETVHLLLYVVAAYSGGTLQDATNGKLHLMEQSQSNVVASFDMERSQGCVDVVAAMFRAPSGGWRARIMDIPAENGRHFMDVLPLLSTVVRSFIPSAPQRQKVAFAMEKGGVMDLPIDMAQVTVGLGWDVDCGACDLDVSAVLLDHAGNYLEAVFFGQLESAAHGIVHSGDNLTGEGDGDDEQISVPLSKVGHAVQQVMFVVNIYSPGRTFQEVANPYARVVDNSTGDELCRYSLAEAPRENGLVIARLVREPPGGDRWGFHALGLPCRGRTYKDSLPQIGAAAQVKTGSLMARSLSILSTDRQALSMPPACRFMPSAPPLDAFGQPVAGFAGYAPTAEVGCASCASKGCCTQ